MLFLKVMNFFNITLYICYILVICYKQISRNFFAMIVIAFPMIIHKIDMANPMFKIIGISYITFRTIQAIVDSQNYGKLSFFEFTSFYYFQQLYLQVQ